MLKTIVRSLSLLVVVTNQEGIQVAHGLRLHMERSETESVHTITHPRPGEDYSWHQNKRKLLILRQRTLENPKSLDTPEEENAPDIEQMVSEVEEMAQEILKAQQNIEHKAGEIIKWNFDEREVVKAQLVTYPDGTEYYVGEFKDGERNGKGSYSFTDGENREEFKYVGEWKNGLYDGEGAVFFESGPLDVQFNSSLGCYKIFFDGANYVGDFKNGKYNGRGSYTYSKKSGAKYVGEWKDGEWNGKGIWITPAGHKYVGEFENGHPKQNGNGIWKPASIAVF